MVVTNQEWKQMESDAIEYERKIKKVNTELAEELFTEFKHEFKKLTKCLNALDEFEHEYYTAKWFNIGKKRRYKPKIDDTRLRIDIYEEFVYYSIETLKTAADSINEV